MSGVPSEYWWNFHESCFPFLFLFFDSNPVAYRIHTMRPNVITIIIVAPNHMLFYLPSYLGIWQRKILSLISVFTLPLGICQRRYLPPLVFLYDETFLQLYANWGNFDEDVLNNEERGFLLEGTWLGNRSRKNVRPDCLQPRMRKKNHWVL